MGKLPNTFNKNVFINCPFDKKYESLKRPLLFTVLHLGYNPKIASAEFDSGEPRVNKIYKLIGQSKFSIHDLSRMETSGKGKISRFNMPFELGVDIGCRLFKTGLLKRKKCLILEEKKFRYQKALSDLSNSDIKNHNNKEERIVREVRNWFVENKPSKSTPSSTSIWEDYNEFMADFYQECKKKKFKKTDLYNMPTPEYLAFAKSWLRKRKKVNV